MVYRNKLKIKDFQHIQENQVVQNFLAIIQGK